MKTGIATVLVLALILPAATLCQEAEAPEPQGLMKPYLEAAGAMAEGQVDDARRAYAEGLNDYPDSPHLNLGAARAAAAAGDLKACLESLDRLETLGGMYGLAVFKEFAPFLDEPEFKIQAASLHPEANPTSPPDTVYILEDPTLWNEGIACDLATGDLYAGSIKHGKIVRLRDGVQEDFGTTAEDGLLEVIGLDIDEQRRHLWAATGRDDAPEGAPHDFGEAPRANEIVVYDMETGKQVMKFTMEPDDRIHMWNDISVAPDGTAYFTDMTAGEIWRIPPGGEPEVYLTLENHNSPNGIVIGDAGLLYIACLEEILVVDVADGTIAPLQRGLDTYTGLGDGLAFGGGSLFITQNSGLLGMRVLQCRLDDTGREVTETRRIRWTQPEGRMPYTCALGDGVLYVNATAPFAIYDDPEPPPPSAIVEIRLDR